ncbi:MAG: hypothetical protein QF535_03080 [Anaerolineales bacterium]|jgi:hypothetical protein|nr:hypothetical protein [Anaerolineales bacterium]
MDKFRKKLEQFSNLCEQVNIPIPEIEESHVVGSEYTEPNLVRMTAEADVEHLFGHYLCEYHAIEPVVVADIIKNLLYASEQSYMNRGFYPNPVAKVAVESITFDDGFDESNDYHFTMIIPDDGFEDA